MQEWFDVLVTGTDLTRHKPHPEGIFRAMEHLGGEPAETVYVGDTNADVRAGRAAGVHTVGVRWFSSAASYRFDPEPDRVCEKVEELKRWMEEFGKVLE